MFGAWEQSPQPSARLPPTDNRKGQQTKHFYGSTSHDRKVILSMSQLLKLLRTAAQEWVMIEVF